MASKPIYQLYAELDDYEPKIWRRFQVLDNITVARLGYILMSLFEMEARHLFAFEYPCAENYALYARAYFNISADEIEENAAKMQDIPPRRYTIPDDESSEFVFPGEVLDEDATRERLHRVLSVAGQNLLFDYDFGDGWRIAVVLEKIIHDESLPGKDLPRVLEGDGYGIIEDCGGVAGLADLAEAFSKKSGEAYDAFRAWLGVDGLDLDTFDLEDANFRVKKVPRIYAQAYEQGLSPTQQSLDLLERKYLDH